MLEEELLMKAAGIIFGILLAVYCWVDNFHSFLSCDFEPGDRCEIAHGVGVFIPNMAPITVWFGDDEE
jgi:hypothetical protein